MRRRFFCAATCRFSTLFGSLGRREDGQSLAGEVITVALIAFAVFGAFTLLGRL
jgi:hypothetical protein